MGRGDNRRSPKMRRLKAQSKKKARLTRSREASRAAGKKPAAKEVAPKKKREKTPAA